MTIFEKIIAREIPATIEYEDDDIIAIQDIAPNAPVHVLIIPKVVIPSVNQLEEQHHQLIGKVFTVARSIAEKHGIAESGYRIVTNVNHDAGQTVFHLHFHLLGGAALGAMNQQVPINSAGTSKTLKNLGGVREISMFVVAAIGLAIVFNSMNPKRIPWLKPTFEHTQASDALLGLTAATESPNVTKNYTQPIAHEPSSNTLVDKGGTAEITHQNSSQKENFSLQEKPNTKSGVVSATPESAQKDKTPTFTPQPGVVLEINLSQFKRLLAGPHFLIDARTASSYGAGHIGKAMNVYGGEVESRIPELLGVVPTDKVILIYCDGGECELSHHVADALKQFGYGPICIFTGGWEEWTKSKATH